MKFSSDLLIFLALLKRDIKVLSTNVITVLIDSFVHSACFIVLFGFFLPAMGMPKTFSFPLFLGSVINTILSTGYSRAVIIKSDLEFNKTINFYLILPISKKWLLAKLITLSFLDLLLASTPILILGILVLGKIKIFSLINFILIYIVSLLFVSIFFLILAVCASWRWLLNNTWERMLTPMVHFGSMYFIWKNLNDFSPTLAKISLLDPITYISEGFRGSIIGTQDYLPTIICINLIFIGCLILLYVLWNSINKYLDMV